jgi:hypothetical protein
MTTDHPEASAPAEPAPPAAEPAPRRFAEFLTADEAAAFLGIEPRQFGATAQQYGIGRRYRADPRPGWGYLRSELEHVKTALTAGKGT